MVQWCFFFYERTEQEPSLILSYKTDRDVTLILQVSTCILHPTSFRSYHNSDRPITKFYGFIHSIRPLIQASQQVRNSVVHSRKCLASMMLQLLDQVVTVQVSCYNNRLFPSSLWNNSDQQTTKNLQLQQHIWPSEGRRSWESTSFKEFIQMVPVMVILE